MKKPARRPVEEFLDSLQDDAEAKVFRNIQLLKEFGIDLGWPFVSNLGENLWELRTKFKGNEYRVLFLPVPGKAFLLLHAFRKDTRRLPEHDRNLAVKRLAEYLRGGGKPDDDQRGQELPENEE
ncbi:MAG TPA: type II toxin-antitoxin system RelE/ParE family toxin [Spirochaetia bacterium]|nr:type II toxin-antitoxin system RelE/ParE family toxin [Spirochaetia bacterium]